ncbi:unnamed protein product [Dovyalis caffra]|uniref:Kinesin motor domain-containing protein n=1 Tax=Dovyalis caffra TaxID=77055 RepID=A0AAV1S1I4_9ROSI|nr:unnamed protein product [Dovyalis caffra]
MVLLSPTQTPRSSVRRSLRDSLLIDWSSNMIKPDKGVNVQVILCCRPLNDEEMQLMLPGVISCNEDKGEVSVIQNTASKQIDKTFSFDKVFGPTSQQKELFEEAIAPTVNEVLEGYNCTIFAYGQTGTGKTYTMEGGRVAESGEFPSDVGIIPRAVQQIFNVLEVRNEDYSMRVTFLELYYEEIMDLLAPDEISNDPDDKSKKPLALMEDGRGGVFIRGLEQELSSSIGEELIKCGKLDLFDLAGSKNVVRSGAKELSSTFSGDSSVKQESGDQNILSDICESAHSLNNSRVTFTAVN